MSCSQFVKNIVSKSIHHSELYYKINPILFDVSLRDGIQGARHSDWPTSKKREVFSTIQSVYNPQSIEIGSLCSYKLLPIMADTQELYNHTMQSLAENNNNPENTSIYVLIPSFSKLPLSIKCNMKHLSFITSVSNTFQLKNTNMTIQQVKTNFANMFEQFKGELDTSKCTKKLYISCINECPIVGKLDNDFIVNEILSYHSSKFSFDELCLSDTCGTLQYDDFCYIVEHIHFFGIPLSKISIHLHVSKNNLENLENILRYCFRKGIRKFDIAMVETGGCSVTMKSEALLSNMTYEQFYTILYKHIDAVVEYNLL